MLRMRFTYVVQLLLCISSIPAQGQMVSAPEPQVGTIIGTVVDPQGAIIPSATVVIDGSSTTNHSSVTTSEGGSFSFRGLSPGIAYHVTVNAQGFSEWRSSDIVLSPGQQMDLGSIKLMISAVETSVTAVTIEQLAAEQVHAEEKQRVLGIVPNYYVTYHPNPVPLTRKLKFELALKTSTDVVTFAGVALLAGINQAADTPNYDQGAKGFGQRLGASYANGVSDTLIGGAVLPSLLHQDPRYFYQGTGTTKSRLLHALSSPFLCKGDNGKWQFNYSSIGGDLAAGALANAYYPDSNRGPGLVFSTAGVDTGARIALAIAQEFLLRKLTPSAKKN